MDDDGDVSRDVSLESESHRKACSTEEESFSSLAEEIDLLLLVPRLFLRRLYSMWFRLIILGMVANCKCCLFGQEGVDNGTSVGKGRS